MEGIEDNDPGRARAQNRLKLLHPLPPGRKRYPTEFERWSKKIFEGRPVAGDRIWLTAAFWQNEVDRALIDAIFGNVAKDEVIGRICSAWPKLSALWLNEHLEEVARAGLPRWMDKDFWPNEVDPILLVGIRNSNGCEREAVEAALREWPELEGAAIWNRLRRLRRQRCEGAQTAVSRLAVPTVLETKPSVNTNSTMDRTFGPDPLLLAGIRDGQRHERESVKRVLNKFPELRVGSIWTRLWRLREQQREQAQIGVPFEWTTELDQHSRRIHAEAGLRAGRERGSVHHGVATKRDLSQNTEARAAAPASGIEAALADGRVSVRPRIRKPHERKGNRPRDRKIGKGCSGDDFSTRNRRSIPRWIQLA